MTLADQGASVEEISDHTGMNVAEVKLVLSAHNAAPDRDINDDELAFLRQKAVRLAMQDHDLNVAARMTQFLIERDKPRTQQVTSPIAAINKAIIIANDSFKSLLSDYAPQTLPEKHD
jgi:hypothetical protein